MKNLWKKISLILAGAVVVLFFSNDFGLIDVEKTAIITAIGVDLAESGNFDEVNRMARLCDQRQIPFASNVATAEVLILGLNRGDLDWRDIVNPKKKS